MKLKILIEHGFGFSLQGVSLKKIYEMVGMELTKYR